MQFLDELHLELLHLHHFFFFLSSQVVLVVDAVVVLSLHLVKSALSVLFDFHCSHALLLVHDLILHAVFLLDLEVLELFLLFVLLLDDLGLFGLFALRLEDGLLDLSLLVLSLLIDGVVVLGDHSLVLVLDLVVVDFLINNNTTTVSQSSNCSIDSSLKSTYLLDAVFIALLERQDLICALLRVIDLLPCLLLFLLKQGNTIGEQLGIPLDAIDHKSQQVVNNCPGQSGFNHRCILGQPVWAIAIIYLLFPASFDLSKALHLGLKEGFLLGKSCLSTVLHLLSRRLVRLGHGLLIGLSVILSVHFVDGFKRLCF